MSPESAPPALEAPASPDGGGGGSSLDLAALAHLEALAALEDPAADRDALLADLTRIVEHVRTLDVALGDAEAERVESFVRADEPRAGLSREAALGGSAHHDETSFLVPRIVP